MIKPGNQSIRRFTESPKRSDLICLWHTSIDKHFVLTCKSIGTNYKKVKMTENCLQFLTEAEYVMFTPTPCLKCWSCTLVKHTLIHCWRIFPLSGITQVTHFSTLGNVINPFLVHSTDPNLPNGLFLSVILAGKLRLTFGSCIAVRQGVIWTVIPSLHIHYTRSLTCSLYSMWRKNITSDSFPLLIRDIKQPNLYVHIVAVCFSCLDKWLNWLTLNREVMVHLTILSENYQVQHIDTRNTMG